MNARRLLRWLRLVVATLAFVVASPPPATAIEAFDQVVFVANEEAGEREEARAEHGSIDVPAIVADEPRAVVFESRRLVSRRWLTNCAFLL